MHSFSPLFAILWPPKTGSGIKYLLMTFSLDDISSRTLVVTESWQHLINDYQNITRCDIQSLLKFFSLRTPSGLLSREKKCKTKNV